MEQSWTRSTTSLFIKEVKKRPILWNKKLTPYLDKCDEDKAWGQIAKIMGWTGNQTTCNIQIANGIGLCTFTE